jgi:hypothetical protein
MTDVTEADREFLIAFDAHFDWENDDIRAGKWDDHDDIKRIVAFREASVAAERARGQKLADWLGKALKIIDRANGIWMGESDARKALAAWDAGK